MPNIIEQGGQFVEMPDVKEPDAVNEQQRKGQMVKEMMTSEGWQVLQNDLIEVSKSLTDELIEEDDMDKIYRLQAELKAIKVFFEKVITYASIK